MKKWMPFITPFMGDSYFIIITTKIIYLTANELSQVAVVIMHVHKYEIRI